MLVTKLNFEKSLDDLRRPGLRGLDTESTGLTEKDRLFCITIADGNYSYYFNFQEYPGIQEALPREWLGRLSPIFQNPKNSWFIHNAKHDLKFLMFEGLYIMGKVICTEVQERVLHNNYLGAKPYSLASCAKRRGLSKDEEVDAYIMEHGLYEKVYIPGKKKIVLQKHFDKVPFDIISKRATGDALLHYQLGIDQHIKLGVMDAEDSAKQGVSSRISNVANNEINLTKVCFKMERTGIRIDRDYTERALAYERTEIERGVRDFKGLTGIDFSDGRTCLRAAFDALGERYPTTELGNPSFTESVLESMETPVASLVNRIRHHQKRASTYYSSFLYFAQDDIIHPNMRQSGTTTGRFSYSDPNLQNVPKEDRPSDRTAPFSVRKCFIPTNRDAPLVCIDFMQQEFRLMLDYAGEKSLITAINDGADVHQATADLIGIHRSHAKTINFGLLYGMGIGKMAKSLKISEKEAQGYRDKYFSKLPMVKKFLKNVAFVARQRGFVRNWAGRRCYLPARELDYVMPNHIIQGGCADILKSAMVEIDNYFDRKCMRTRLNLQVHDELVFNWAPQEYEEIHEVKKIMEAVYKPRNGMKMGVSVDHSFVSWGYFDKVKGMPGG